MTGLDNRHHPCYNHFNQVFDMKLKLKDSEFANDFVVRKGKADFRLYPMSIRAKDWVAADQSLVVTTINEQSCLVCTRAGLQILLDDIRKAEMKV